MKPKKARLYPLPAEEQEEEFDIYTNDGIESVFDDDEISAHEEGFMKGYVGQ